MEFKLSNKILNYLTYHDYKLERVTTRFDHYDYPDEFIRSDNPQYIEPLDPHPIKIIKYIVTNGAGGILIEDEDPQELIKKLTKIIPK